MKTTKFFKNWSAGLRSGSTQKTFALAILIICAALLCSISQAGPANDSESSATSPTGGVGQVPLPTAVSPQLSGASRVNPTVVKSPSANIPTVGQLFSISSSKPTKPVPNSLHGPATSHSAIQPAGPLLGKAPDHGLAPAVVGGPAATKIKTTAAVTGTGLNRKP